MNIGEPKRTIEVEPATLPVPEELPVPEPARGEPEPELVPAGVAARRPEEQRRAS
jgi:hypothetical protein